MKMLLLWKLLVLDNCRQINKYKHSSNMKKIYLLKKMGFFALFIWPIHHNFTIFLEDNSISFPNYHSFILAKKGVGPIAKQYSTKRQQEIVTNNNNIGRFTIISWTSCLCVQVPHPQTCPQKTIEAYTVNMTIRLTGSSWHYSCQMKWMSKMWDHDSHQDCKTVPSIQYKLSTNMTNITC